ncbi:hypothetical protein [Streptomyces sp. NPDC054975]
MSHTLQWTASPSGRTGHATFWTVTAFGNNGHQAYATMPLEYADVARAQYDRLHATPGVNRVEIAEMTSQITERLIAMDDLPGPEKPTPVPELPEGADHIGRHYRFSWGRPVLRTGDDVRSYFKWLSETQISPLPTLPRVDPHSLRLLEVTTVRRTRPIGLADLP